MENISKILVPTDFSETAGKALEVAISIAAKNNAVIDLLHVFHVPVIDPNMPTDTLDIMIDEMRQSANNKLQRLVAEKGHGATIKPVSLMGYAVDEIVEYAESENIPLIVMGTTGASGLKEVLFGSNAGGVVEKTSSLVLTVPPGTNGFNPKNVVYACDFEKSELDASDQFVGMARLFGAELTVLYVKNDNVLFSAKSPEQRFNELKAAVGYDKMSLKLLEGMDVYDTIIHYLESNPCDLLASAHYKRGTFTKLFHRSLTKRLLYHVNIPMLTYFKK